MKDEIIRELKKLKKQEVQEYIEVFLINKQIDVDTVVDLSNDMNKRHEILKTSNLVDGEEYRKKLGISEEEFWSLIPYKAINSVGKLPEELLREVEEAIGEHYKEDYRLKADEEISELLGYLNFIIKDKVLVRFGRYSKDRFRNVLYEFKRNWLSKKGENVKNQVDSEGGLYLSYSLVGNRKFHIPRRKDKVTKAQNSDEIFVWNKKKKKDLGWKIESYDYFNRAYILMSYYNCLFEKEKKDSKSD